jgi:hypothetical protein
MQQQTNKEKVEIHRESTRKLSTKPVSDKESKQQQEKEQQQQITKLEKEQITN